jgi:hypothetical protein
MLNACALRSLNTASTRWSSMPASARERGFEMALPDLAECIEPLSGQEPDLAARPVARPGMPLVPGGVAAL